MGNGLFGDLDIDEISDDPFKIDNGYYTFVVTKTEWQTFEPNDGTDTKYHNSTYTCAIEDADSPFYSKPVQQRFSRYPDLTRGDLEEMTPKQKQQILDNMARHKQFLKGIGCSETEIARCGDSEEDNLQVTQGRVFTGKYVENSGKGENKDKTYRNIQNVKPVQNEPEDTSNMGGLEF